MSGDIVIIGGGLAGLTAANRAAELGLNPILLEQGSDPQYFCNSRLAGGILHVAFKDLAAAPKDIAAAIRAQTGEDEATVLGSVMAEDCGRALTWLRGEGAKFIKGGSLEFMRWILAPPRPRARSGASEDGSPGPEAKGPCPVYYSDLFADGVGR